MGKWPHDGPMGPPPRTSPRAVPMGAPSSSRASSPAVLVAAVLAGQAAAGEAVRGRPVEAEAFERLEVPAARAAALGVRVETRERQGSVVRRQASTAGRMGGPAASVLVLALLAPALGHLFAESVDEAPSTIAGGALRPGAAAGPGVGMKRAAGESRCVIAGLEREELDPGRAVGRRRQDARAPRPRARRGSRRGPPPPRPSHARGRKVEPSASFAELTGLNKSARKPRHPARAARAVGHALPPRGKSARRGAGR